MKDFVCVNNISGKFWDNLDETRDYELYINSYSWILKIEDYWNFFYTPYHFIGKIKDSQMPQIVVSRIKEYDVYFKDGILQRSKNTENVLAPSSKVLKQTPIRLSKLEHTLGIGNWFYAMGQNFVTFNNTFVCDDVYMPNLERECSLSEIDGSIVFDYMLGMGCRTRTPHYYRGIFDFPCFNGVDSSDIRIYNFDEKKWDSDKWTQQFQWLSESVRVYKSQASMDEIRQMRKDVFTDTINVVRQGYYDLDDGNKITLPPSNEVVRNTKFYSCEIKVNENESFPIDTIIKVDNIDCLVAANNLQREGYNVAVLNMASRQNPGGGVYSGAGAQEENLFRRSNLFQSMFQFAPYASQYGIKKSVHQYPLDKNFGGIYTKNATVFRDTEANGYALLEEPVLMSFISVPGMNRPELNSEGMIVDSLVEPIKNKIRTIFRIGLENGHDALVLGALGCGAFRNPPKHIARLFHEVIEEPEFANQYKLLLFAILEDHNSHHSHNPEGNFKPFKDEFSNNSK